MLCLYPVGLLIGNEREVTAGEYRRDNDNEHHDKDDATLILAMVRSFIEPSFVLNIPASPLQVSL